MKCPQVPKLFHEVPIGTQSDVPDDHILRHAIHAKRALGQNKFFQRSTPGELSNRETFWVENVIIRGVPKAHRAGARRVFSCKNSIVVAPVALARVKSVHRRQREVANYVFSYYKNTVWRSINERGDTRFPTMILSMRFPTDLYSLNWSRTPIRQSSSALDQIERERFSKSYGLNSLMSGCWLSTR